MLLRFVLTKARLSTPSVILWTLLVRSSDEISFRSVLQSRHTPVEKIDDERWWYLILEYQLQKLQGREYYPLYSGVLVILAIFLPALITNT